MAPPFKAATKDSDSWWKDAWKGRDDISVQYELVFGKDTIRPGTRLKFKNNRGVYKFRCLAHSIPLNVTWIDCVDINTGEFRSFYVDKLKNIVKPKKSRRKKKN